MATKLLQAWSYQGDAMNLPVADVDAAVGFYVEKLGFKVVELDSGPSEPPNVEAVKRVVLERDGVRMALAENGGDPSQDGVAFHVNNVEELFREFEANGWEPPPTRAGKSRFEIEDHGDDGSFKVFYVVAPDGLCFWFGEKQ